MKKTIKEFIKKHKDKPLDKLVYTEDILLVSLKEELPHINSSIDFELNLELVRKIAIKSIDSYFLEGDDQDIYDAMFSCVFSTTRELFNRDDDDDDIEFEHVWKESLDDSVTLYIFPKSKFLK